MSFLLGFLLTATAIFLILLVLVQRGRGGGLTGALGGMGGQSAFGSKAGDVFTRITIGTAFVWILLCVASVKLLGGSHDKLSEDLGGAAAPPSGPFVTEPLDATGTEKKAVPGGASEPAAPPGSASAPGGPAAGGGTRSGGGTGASNSSAPNDHGQPAGGGVPTGGGDAPSPSGS